MAESTRVVTRSRRRESEEHKGFQFTEAMIPNFASDRASIEFRMKSWQVLNSLPMPTSQAEAWRRTNIKELQTHQFRLAQKNAYQELIPVPQYLLDPVTGEQPGGQLVLSPGGAQLNLDPAIQEKGVIFTDYLTAEQKYPELVNQIRGTVVKPEDGKFSALASAMANNGVFVYVPQGVQVDQPLHSLFWGPGVNLAHINYLLIWVDKGSSLTYVHEGASPSEVGGQTLHNMNIEILVGEGASLKFVELQSFGDHVWNFGHERARLERDAQMDWIFGAIGSHLTKSFMELELVGQGAVGKMSGFYFTNGNQHLDHDTQQNHLAPHTTSDLLFKGALEDDSRSVWRGMIHVAPNAQKADGYQANRNLILSKAARADSIPGLEILADDVRCTHGATIGKVDENLIFYLVSRGISRRQAERMVVEGFFDPIMQRIPFEGVRERFQEAIKKKMG